MLIFGVTFGIDAWLESARTNVPATAGTVMLSAMPMLMGFQLTLNFLQNDIAMVPKKAIHKRTALLSVLDEKARRLSHQREDAKKPSRRELKITSSD